MSLPYSGKNEPERGRGEVRTHRNLVGRLKEVWRFYYEGFRNMTWGRILWVLILLKLFILFAILRVFFFRPVLEGKSEQEKIETVCINLEESRP